MKWKQFTYRIKCSFLITTKFAIQQTRMRVFMPGTFQREIKSAGIRIVEQVIIQQVSIIAEMYCIRKVVWRYTSPEEKTVLESKAEEWMATYDLARRQLQEIAGKRSCAFIPENSLLLLENNSYFKIDTSKSLVL